ncbi:homoserine O-acetyltransferase MetX [Hoyosella altamirensis]|uniref:Homoserine O-acetyltransferase n=1 Tax=Hoyosella altamirensis TaxID=616997 RepID=A0A839RV99_9ACTN|nr:homoserine O-acetyltransferase [Hoyosella altamirensis]MBB3039711.1 homoserine O-acetyltransferase [Hoyosella altamirensis]
MRAPSRWRAPDPALWPEPDGTLGYVDIGSLRMENGALLPDVTLALQRWGEVSPKGDNVILALHALTGDSHVTGPADDEHLSPGWWDGLIGPGAAVDTNEWCVLSANSVGGCRGSTGPGSLAPDGKPWGSRFPAVTIRDQVNAELQLANLLGIERFASVLGGSMGGARALEWEVSYPDRVATALVLAVGARATADQIGTQSAQILAIKTDPHWQGGDYYGTGREPEHGLGVARRIAHLSYRGEEELDERFGNSPQDGVEPFNGGTFSIQSYLDHQAGKLVRRFDAGSYVILSDSLSSHDVGRGRGGIQKALAGCPTPTIVGGITSDRLYPLRLQEELAAHLLGCNELRVLNTDKGHDGFLTDFDGISVLLSDTMDLARKTIG